MTPPGRTHFGRWLTRKVAAGLHEDAVRTAELCAALPVAGFPGAVNAALAGARARSELGLPFDHATIVATSSGFANLRAAVSETTAIVCDDPHVAADHFRQAAEWWCGVSSRSARRCQWSAADAVLRAGDRQQAIALLAGIDDTAPVWLRRRADATRRAAGRARGKANVPRPATR